MVEKYQLVGTGYLYSVWNGKLKEYKGDIWHSDKCTVDGYILPERTLFDVVDERGKKIKWVIMDISILIAVGLVVALGYYGTKKKK